MSKNHRVALVTGGAHRVGRVLALALAQHGIALALHYHRSTEEAEATLHACAAYGVDTLAVPGDLTQVSEVRRVVDDTVAHFGRLDMLLCNAGIWGRTPCGSVTEEEWDAFFNLNVRGVFFMAQHAAPQLRATQGCIVTLLDIGTETTWKHYTPYLASKAALAMVTRNLAHDLAPDVRVNGIAPGPVLLPDDWGEEQQQRAARRTLLGRVGTPEDVAQAMLYLIHAPYVTGVIVPVDGGYMLGRTA